MAGNFYEGVLYGDDRRDKACETPESAITVWRRKSPTHETMEFTGSNESANEIFNWVLNGIGTIQVVTTHKRVQTEIEGEQDVEIVFDMYVENRAWRMEPGDRMFRVEQPAGIIDFWVVTQRELHEHWEVVS